ncbi:MAG: N-acetylmuramoyl-L-alanine amidase, partial [Bacteroidota bacterium]
MKIVVEGDTSHTISLSSFDEGRLTYASLDDLAAGLGVRTFWNEETKKLELKLKNYRIKFTADNPFVVITDLAASAANVRQLPASVASHGGKLYAPMVLLFPLFNAVSEKHISILSPTEPVSTVPSVPPSPFDITDLSIEPKLNGYVVRIPTTKRFDEFESWQKPDGWLYVTIANAKADVEKINTMKPAGIFSRILAIQYPTSVQLTFRLTRNIASSEIISDPSSNDILLSLRLPSEADSIAAEGERKELLTTLEGARKRWKLDAIVIDAGHGGNDPGAMGVTRVREKDVTLGIALKLGKLIEKNLKDLKVV